MIFPLGYSLLFPSEFMISEVDLHHADELASVGLLEKTGPLGEAVPSGPGPTEAPQTCCGISQLEINVAVNSTKQFHLMTNMLKLWETLNCVTVMDSQVSF